MAFVSLRRATSRYGTRTSNTMRSGTRAALKKPVCWELFTRIPIRVKSSQQTGFFRAALVPDLIVFDVRVPYRDVALLNDTNAIQPVHDFEHSTHYALEWKIWTERLFIEVIQRGPLLFGVISDIPRLQLAFSGESGQILILFPEMSYGLLFQVRQKLLRPRPTMRHAVF